MEKELLNTFDKELLLKDLCARLPYGVKVESVFINTDTKKRKSCGIEVFDATCILMIRDGFGEFKPYLFPLSSMTDEQRKEFLSVAGYERRVEDYGRHTETYYYDMVGHECEFYPNSDVIDYCNKNHLDYRGLIPMGLAIDATGLNIY